jgi:hypothetical protein
MEGSMTDDDEKDSDGKKGLTRRQFISSVGTAAAIAAVSGKVTASEEEEEVVLPASRLRRLPSSSMADGTDWWWNPAGLSSMSSGNASASRGQRWGASGGSAARARSLSTVFPSMRA